MDNPDYKRIRISTPDDDFLDIDTLINKNAQAVILIHGLEGSSSSNYIKSLALLLQKNKFDVFAVNLRGCSGEPNLVKTSYHSGRTEDLETVINYIKANYGYEKLNLVGFSLGGNLVLKYLGENSACKIDKAASISVPCDLKSSCLKLQEGFNRIYEANFVRTLKEKLLAKIGKFEDFGITQEQINDIETVHDFDELYTAPFHGYKDANDYYSRCSSKQFIKDIKTPTLLINALDDPFLTPECFPFKEAEENPNFTFIATKHGAHVGFMESFNDEVLWMEKRVLESFKDD